MSTTPTPTVRDLIARRATLLDRLAEAQQLLGDSEAGRLFGEAAQEIRTLRTPVETARSSAPPQAQAERRDTSWALRA